MGNTTQWASHLIFKAETTELFRVIRERLLANRYVVAVFIHSDAKDRLHTRHLGNSKPLFCLFAMKDRLHIRTDFRWFRSI